MRIYEAVREVMKRRGKPMTAKEAYGEIKKFDLYDFNTPNPVHIVNTQIRRHCKGIPDKKSYSRTKYFELVGKN
jgi:restriction system protein